jgi:hypothetical protein
MLKPQTGKVSSNSGSIISTTQISKSYVHVKFNLVFVLLRLIDKLKDSFGEYSPAKQYLLDRSLDSLYSNLVGSLLIGDTKYSSQLYL